MQDNLNFVKAFVQALSKLMPGLPVTRLTVAIEDGGTTLEAFDNGDETKWNVAIGYQGTGTFTVAEAKNPTEEVLQRVAKEILGLTPEERAAQEMIEQVDAQLGQLAHKRQALSGKEQEIAGQIAENRVRVEAEAERLMMQLGAAKIGLEQEENYLKAYRNSLLKVAPPSKANGKG